MRFTRIVRLIMYLILLTFSTGCVTLFGSSVQEVKVNPAYGKKLTGVYTKEKLEQVDEKLVNLPRSSKLFLGWAVYDDGSRQPFILQPSQQAPIGWIIADILFWPFLVIAIAAMGDKGFTYPEKVELQGGEINNEK